MNAIRIKTVNICPPIPTRAFDWCAYDDATYSGEFSDPCGYGATEQEAIDDLLQQVEDRS